MNAISRLKRSGLSRAEIADGVGVTPHMVGMYERQDRFPSREKFTCIVELAEARGITLLARDFVSTEAECEPLDGPRRKVGRAGRRKSA